MIILIENYIKVLYLMIYLIKSKAKEIKYKDQLIIQVHLNQKIKNKRRNRRKKIKNQKLNIKFNIKKSIKKS